MVNRYSKTEILNGKYVTTNVVETIESSKEIIAADETIIFKVLATGAYGRIKVSDGVHQWTLSNPFSNHFQKGEDCRTLKMIFLGLNPSLEYVLDMSKAKFDLSPETMGDLHHKIFVPYKDKSVYWVELNDENLSFCH